VIKKSHGWLFILRRLNFIAAFTGSLAFLTTVSLAKDLPDFRKGMWEFKIALESEGGQAQTMTVKKCTNPMEDLKKQNEMLAKSGCNVSRIRKDGKTYTFTSQCGKQGHNSQSKTVITVDGDASYSIDADSEQGGEQSKHKLVARRIGDC